MDLSGNSAYVYIAGSYIFTAVGFLYMKIYVARRIKTYWSMPRKLDGYTENEQML